MNEGASLNWRITWTHYNVDASRGSLTLNMPAARVWSLVSVSSELQPPLYFLNLNSLFLFLSASGPHSTPVQTLPKRERRWRRGSTPGSMIFIWYGHPHLTFTFDMVCHPHLAFTFGMVCHPHLTFTFGMVCHPHLAFTFGMVCHPHLTFTFGMVCHPHLTHH